MHEKKSGPSTSRRRFDEEFKRQAVRLITEQKYSFRAAAEALGVNEGLLRRWHQAFAAAPELGGAETTLEQLRSENARLRQQLKRVELEREILKKATAYFAKESR